MISIFSKLPNDLIIDIIKIAEDERKKDYYWKWIFGSCLYQLQVSYEIIKYEYNLID